ncbi:MAG: PadR family transcriptional regulator [Clostridiales bacterium]|nr:PadR family transcriptional regulator [Clostridiales bacterium]
MSRNQKLSKELVRGTTSLIVLSVLRREDLYGYQIIRTLETLSEDVFSLNEGTLYPILHSLEKEGYLTCRWEETDSARKRKYYHITEKGIRELERQKAQWEVYQGAVSKILGGAGHAFA